MLQNGPPCRLGRFHEFSAGRRGGLRLGSLEVYGLTAQVAPLSGRPPDRCPRRRRGGARRAARPAAAPDALPGAASLQSDPASLRSSAVVVRCRGRGGCGDLEQPPLRPAATGCNRWAPQGLRTSLAVLTTNRLGRTLRWRAVVDPGAEALDILRGPAAVAGHAARGVLRRRSAGSLGCSSTRTVDALAEP